MTRFLIGIAAFTITAAALAQAPATQPPAGTSFDAYAERARARLMALDTDHDGRISKAEFAARAAMRGGAGDNGNGEAQGGGRGDGSRMFARLDTNQDGYLDAAEINAMLARRFARMDANHDGVLTPDERQAMRNPAAPDR